MVDELPLERLAHAFDAVLELCDRSPDPVFAAAAAGARAACFDSAFHNATDLECNGVFAATVGRVIADRLAGSDDPVIVRAVRSLSDQARTILEDPALPARFRGERLASLRAHVSTYLRDPCVESVRVALRNAHVRRDEVETPELSTRTCASAPLVASVDGKRICVLMADVSARPYAPFGHLVSGSGTSLLEIDAGTESFMRLEWHRSGWCTAPLGEGIVLEHRSAVRTVYHLGLVYALL